MSRYIDSPCLNCKERIVGCHSTCEKYLEFKTKVEHRRNTVNAIKEKEANMSEQMKYIRRKFVRKK